MSPVAAPSTALALNPDGSENEMYMIIIAIVTALFFFVLMALAVICYSQRKLARQVSNAGAKEMTNGLVVAIPIGHYERYCNFTNLPVDRDAKNMKELAEYLEYNFLTIDGKLNWTEKEVMDFMQNRVCQEFFDEAGNPKYDGLIVSLSGHGVRNHIVTSDGKRIDRTSIHRCISNQRPKIREFPRIFIFDACDGAGDRRASVHRMEKIDSESESDGYMTENDKKVDMQKSADIAKHTELEDVQKDDDWTKSSKNPDYNLIAVHASNAGFVAKMHSAEEVGSYLTYFFTKTLRRYIDDGKTDGLGVMMDEIEKKLHDAGKQQIRTEFFTETRKLRIEKNVFA